MRTVKLINMTGINNHLANMEVGEGKYEHKFLSCSGMTEKVFGHDQVLLTVKTNEPNEWALIKTLNEEFGGAGFQPW